MDLATLRGHAQASDRGIAVQVMVYYDLPRAQALGA
jgi:hypothetical protein